MAAARMTSGRLVEVLGRVVLVIGGLVLLRFAEIRYTHWRLVGKAFFHYQLSGWCLWVGLTALAGLAFGLAGWMQWGRMRFRPSRALLLGLVPLVMLAHFAFIFGFVMPHGWSGPSWLVNLYFWDEEGPMFALAVLLGVAVASGFAPRGERT